MAEKLKQANARKWTVEIVQEHLLAIRQAANNENCLFMGSVLGRRGLYRKVWAYWKKTFSGNDDILEQMLLIDTMFEANVLEAALRKRVPARLAEMTLKNNYGWGRRTREKQSEQELMKLIIEDGRIMNGNFD